MADNTTRRTVLAGTAAGLGLLTVGTVAADEEQVRYVVTGGSPQQLEREGFTVVHEISDANVYLILGPEDADPTSVDGVNSAFEDFTYELDVADEPTEAPTGELEDEQWDKDLINAFDAHDHATGADTRIGIIDTGVHDGHPDLGNVDVDASRTFIDWEESDHTGDVQYHGTHVAGIAAATGSEGVTGVAPDAEIVSLRVFPSEGPLLASVGDTLLALDHAAEQGLDVVNMSIGSAPQPPEENQEGYRIARQQVVRSVTQRGTSVVVSAGNDSQNLQQGGWISLWGSIPRASSISATTEADELADFSNYGANEISVGAPGDMILSTFDPDNEALPGTEYASASGTSMSAPQVAGLVGLVRELDPNANVNQVENAIERGATGDGRDDPETGAGRIDALETVDLL
ncbi:S8 family serine protease [Natrialba magadii ATCC 43099]|uniref:Peptidase S8 and S53 subtilisin kexin sedolisin n=1 Tax=Natrialba magadii (strain ATCC 43099 / DSM 3394 / CCM 3739 / CIP 104546 / IAM 13178 / JCM 8861 / NBRC 102185 / NCIMB 2190 / MS3) TaxID=547559 RepID=D3SVV3_NATMM|nr:S8 family serine peptidase [Natrialba magadii]ADD03672.1 S8 family serine protease [Natrialba magadii ATCC 43099]ELY34437.1 peptidase S8 and S53 subtilisin kexin sedolisin [Natrialba magadii ATCC 43099]